MCKIRLSVKNMSKKPEDFPIICVTDRKSCKRDFLQQVEAIAAAGVAAIIYRDKNLSSDVYKQEAQNVKEICLKYDVRFIRHGYVPGSLEELVHLPESILADAVKASKMQNSIRLPKAFGVSVHSVESAVAAERIGARYITAGHVFSTLCKPGLMPRGGAFLQQVTAAVDIPVYGIGGINSENIAKIKQWGGSGACLMSSFMKSNNPSQLVDEIAAIITG